MEKNYRFLWVVLLLFFLNSSQSIDLSHHGHKKIDPSSDLAMEIGKQEDRFLLQKIWDGFSFETASQEMPLPMPESTCPSIDGGVFDGNWRAFTSTYSRVGESNSEFVLNPWVEGFVNQDLRVARHIIITEQGLDPVVAGEFDDSGNYQDCGQLPMIFPGSDYSIRLGNHFAGAQTEYLSYRMTVDPDNPLFVYRFAIVMEDPGHDETEQPRFQLELTDPNNNNELVDENCGFYKVVAKEGIEGFTRCSSDSWLLSNTRTVFIYSDWQSIGVDLRDYAGQELELRFTTTDCLESGHFGYSYFEPVGCSPLDLSVSTTCNGSSNEIRLEAPEGFGYRWSNGATTQAITIEDPVEGDVISCTLSTSVNNQCDVELEYTIPEQESANVSFTVSDDLCRPNIAFDASSTTLPADATVDEYNWDFGDGETDSSRNNATIEHNYQESGTYTVTLTVSSGDCEYTATDQITVNLVSAGTIAGSQTLCGGEQPEMLSGTMTDGGATTVTYQWQSSLNGTDFTDIEGANEKDYLPDAIDITTSYRRIDSHTIDGGKCDAHSNVVTIEINDIEGVSDITGNQVLCAGEVVNALVSSENLNVGSNVVFQWYQSTNGTDFELIPGETNENFTPTVNASSTWYYRLASSDVSGTVCTQRSSTVKVSVNNIVPGELEVESSFCSGSSPSVIESITAANAEGDLTYQWQQSLDGLAFNDIQGAKEAQYDPGELEEDRWFRRLDSSTLDGKSCSAPTNIIRIRVFELEVGQINAPAIFCADGTIPMITSEEEGNTGANVVYQWERSADGTNFEEITDANEANYRPVDITDSTWFRRLDQVSGGGGSCEGYTNVVKLDLNSIQAGSLENELSLCFGDSLNSITENSPAQASGELSYQWQISINGGDFVDLQGETQRDIEQAEFRQSSVLRRLDRSTINGFTCEAPTNSVSVKVSDPITLPQAIVSNGLCQPGRMDPNARVSIDPLSIIGGDGNYQLIEFFDENDTPFDTSDDILLQSGTTSEFTIPSRGQKMLRIVVTDSSGCSGSTKVTVPAYEIMRVSSTAHQELCVGDANGMIELQIEGGAPPYRTFLEGSNEGFVVGKTTYSNLLGGHDYFIYIQDANGCETAVHHRLEEPVDLSAEMGIQYACNSEGEVENTIAIHLDPELSDQVIFTLDNDPSTATIQPFFQNVSVGEHSLGIAHENGCIRQDISFIVQRVNQLAISAEANRLNSISASASGGLPPYLYSFDNGPFESETTFAFSESGEYWVRVRDSLGCEEVVLLEVEFFPITIPNFFTPNGDGNNDEWSPENTDQYPDLLTSVFDRYGRTVAELRSGQTWDGNYEGEPLPSGDYWYVIEGDGRENSEDQIFGHFTLYR